MTTPIIGAPELVAAQAVPETTVNEIARYLEQGSLWFGKIKDRDLATPPGSPADGDAYLVAASPTGAWTGQAGKIAFRLSTAWEFITPTEGMAIYVADEDVALVFNGTAFVGLTSGGGALELDDLTDVDVSTVPPTNKQALVWDTPTSTWVPGTVASQYTDAMARAAVHAAPTTISGTSHTADITNAFGYLRFTNGSAVTFTIPPQASVDWANGTVIAFEQAGAGVVTLTPGAGVTINSRGGALGTAGQFAAGQIKRVGLNEWTAIGDLA